MLSKYAKVWKSRGAKDLLVAVGFREKEGMCIHDETSEIFQVTIAVNEEQIIGNLERLWACHTNQACLLW